MNANDILVRITMQSAEALEHVNEFVNVLTQRFLGLEAAREAAEWFYELGKQAIDLEDKLWILHERTGMSVESLNGLQYAAARSDVSLEQLTVGMKKMAEWMTKSGEGSGDLTEALLKQAEVFSRMPDGVGKTALAVERFGRAGAQLIPLLNEGPEGIQELISRGGALSGITANMALTAHEAADAWKDFHLAMQSFAGGIMTAFLPAMSRALEKMAEWFAMARVGWQMMLNQVDIVADSLTNMFGKLFADKTDAVALDKASYEQKLKEYELDLKMLEAEAKIIAAKKDLSQTAEDRQKQVNENLAKQVEAMERIKALTYTGIEYGVVPKSDGYAKVAGLDEKQNSLRDKQTPEGLGGNISDAFSKWQQASGPLFHQIADNLVSVVGGAIKTIASNITDVIMATKTWGQALEKIGTTILSSIVNAIIEMGVKWITTHVLMGGALAVFHSIADALTIKSANVVVAGEAIKAPPLAVNAATASVSSFGAAAIIGIAALVAGLGVGVAAAAGAFRERGGPVTAGMPYIVGERRPELFVPSQSGTILPSVPQGGSGSTNVHIGVLSDRSDIPNWVKSRDGEAHIVDVMRRNWSRIT